MRLSGWWETSGELTSSGVAYTGETYFYGILVAGDGANAVTVNVYDNTAGSGKKLCPTFIVPTTDQLLNGPIGLSVRAHNGIYVSLATAGTVSATVYHGA